MANVKLSEIADGSALVPATDKLVSVRGGNTDVQTTPGALAALSTVGATQIDDAAVTLAKMANLAQDLFIVRTTASTGVPQTATVTAAARTVLDDTTVGAMVDTLGGASSSGSGGLVRITSATLVTPILGVAAATTINKVALTAPASGSTLTIADGKTLTSSNTLTLTGTDSSTVACGAGGTVAYLGTVQAFSKQQTLTPQALTSTSNSIAWDANNGNNASHTATENTTLANPTNLVTGTTYTFQWTQHASAAKTLAFGNKWKFAGSSTVSVTVSAVNIITGLYDGTNINCVMTGPFT